MARRHPACPTLPTRWLLTDERQGEALWTALARLPRGAGVVVRHHATAAPERARLFDRIRRIGRRRGLLVACEERSPLRIVLPSRAAAPPWIARVHSAREAAAARRSGARALFVSPVFATRSHPGAPALGPLRAARIARGPLPAYALGGVTRRRFVRLKALGFAGWAAIDGPTRADASNQKRKAVPI